MSVVNQAMDRAMRGLVARRMHPQIAFPPRDTAVIMVAPQRDLLVGDVSKPVQLARTARAAGITVICAPTSHAGGDTLPEFAAGTGDIVLEPFAGLSAFTNPKLSATLADAHLDHVVIAGARTDIEIDSTARDATEAGLHTTVIADCCTGSDPQGHRATIGITLPRLVHAVLTLAQFESMTQ